MESRLTRGVSSNAPVPATYPHHLGAMVDIQEPSRSPSRKDETAFADSRADCDVTRGALRILEAATRIAEAGPIAKWPEEAMSQRGCWTEPLRLGRHCGQTRSSWVIARDHRRRRPRIRRLRDARRCDLRDPVTAGLSPLRPSRTRRTLGRDHPLAAQGAPGFPLRQSRSSYEAVRRLYLHEGARRLSSLSSGSGRGRKCVCS